MKKIQNIEGLRRNIASPEVASPEKECLDGKQAAEALTESEEKFRTLTEKSPNMIFINNMGRIVYVNRRCQEIMGYTREEFLSEDFDFLTIIAPESKALVTSNFRRHMAGDDIDPYEYALINKHGKRIEAIINTKLIHYEGKQALLGIVTDITDRKKAEDALRESEKQYRLLFENANAGIYIAQDGVIKFPNPKAEQIFGCSSKELAKTPFIRLIHPLDREMVMSRNKRRLQGEKLPGAYSFRIINADGETRWVELNMVLINWQGSAATLNFLRDTTEKKRLEDKLQQAQRMEAIGRLAAGIAHEFNNLLMGIQGNISLMLLNVDPEHPNHERLKSIEHSVQNGGELTNQLLGLTKRGRYVLKPTDLNDLLRKSAKTFGRIKEEISIRTQLQEDLWSVEVDRKQIEQVLFQLCMNASQAMPGGGSLHFLTENVVLDATHVKPYDIAPGRYVKISVTDKGGGMDDETLERIFDPFFTTRKMGRSTGLGLAAAYGIIQDHHGIISANSIQGEGTTFQIHLPVSTGKVS